MQFEFLGLQLPAASPEAQFLKQLTQVTCHTGAFELKCTRILIIKCVLS